MQKAALKIKEKVQKKWRKNCIEFEDVSKSRNYILCKVM